MNIELIKDRIYNKENGEPDEEFVLEIVSLLESEMKKERFKLARGNRRCMDEIEDKKCELNKILFQYNQIRESINLNKTELEEVTSTLKEKIVILEKWVKANEEIIENIIEGEERANIFERTGKLESSLRQIKNNLKIIDGIILNQIEKIGDLLPSDIQS